MNFKVYVFILILLPTTGFSQLSGFIFDEKGEAIPGITVQLGSQSKGAISDGEGRFRITDVTKGNHTLTFSGVGFETTTRQVTYKGEPVSLDVTLNESTKELQSVMVVGKSEATEKREVPFAVSVIDVKPLQVQNLDVNQILGTVSGVRIREDGGLGSNFNFSLNGFSNNQVKFFIDGIPMDHFGSSMSLNNIPVNMISGIEVYKGVVPVHLGSDALGGAVNVTTNRSIRNFLDASYSIGSFNTHRAAVVSRVTTEKGLVINSNAFFNYSDNDYNVQVEIADPVTGKVGAPRSVRRFHDGYQSQTAQVELGVQYKPFADQFFVGLIASENYKELQTGANMYRVIGEAFTESRVFIPTLKYAKEDFLLPGLTARVNVIYTQSRTLNVDTASKIYDWYGNYVYRGIDVRSGEISWDKTRFRFNDRSVVSTAFFSYDLNDRQSIALNQTTSSYTRVGKDPISYNAVPFSEPNRINKHITGVSFNQKLLNEKLRITGFGKLFIYEAVTRDGDGYGSDQTLTKTVQSGVYPGYGVASTYFLTKGFQVKSSFESTYRLPEPFEMFGDGLKVQSNPYLEPEQSKNFNIGILGQQIIARHEFLFEAGYLFRLPENMIRSKTTGILVEYENLRSVQANILEAGFKYRYDNKYDIELNGTYQKIVNNEKTTATGGVNYLYGDVVPNMPYLFGNAKAGATFDYTRQSRNSVSINWSTLFVEQFYLYWPSQGSSGKKFIPRQLSHAASASWSLKDGRYNVSLSCNNVFDSQLYDNFMLQKPGRSFNLKLNYFIK